MRRGRRPVGYAAIWLSAAYLGYAAAAAQETAGLNEGGVYSEEQALRGETEYRSHCASCHADNLSGSTYAPALAGDAFLARAKAESLGELFERIRTTMPYDQPDTLTKQAYVDIVAYLLKANGLAAGTKELPPDGDALSAIMLKQ